MTSKLTKYTCHILVHILCVSFTGAQVDAINEEAAQLIPWSDGGKHSCYACNDGECKIDLEAGSDPIKECEGVENVCSYSLIVSSSKYTIQCTSDK